MKPDRYAHILSFVVSHPWAILPEWGPVIAGTLARHIAGVESTAEIAAALVNRKNLPQPKVGSVAIIPVYGAIAPRMNLFSEYSGGTTFEKLTSQLRQAMANADVKTILLDIDSPGGSVAGCAEFTAELMRARTKKPILAQAQFTMASAAYHLASAATEIIAAPSAFVGSIGCYWMHDDLSAALEQLGIKRTFVSAGEGKLDGNETEPISKAAEARRKAIVDTMYGQFVDAVVAGRGKGMTPDRVRSEWKAYVYGSTDALALGMVDRVATLDETLTRLLTDSTDPADQRALVTLSTPNATDQEPPIAATSQERTADTAWQNAIERELQQLDF
ncbi:MAG: S49 family peptidase [Acidobacteriota bacterium]